MNVSGEISLVYFKVKNLSELVRKSWYLYGKFTFLHLSPEYNTASPIFLELQIKPKAVKEKDKQITTNLGQTTNRKHSAKISCLKRLLIRSHLFSKKKKKKWRGGLRRAKQD